MYLIYCLLTSHVNFEAQKVGKTMLSDSFRSTWFAAGISDGLVNAHILSLFSIRQLYFSRIGWTEFIMVQIVGKYQHHKNENLDEYFKACGKFRSVFNVVAQSGVFKVCHTSQEKWCALPALCWKFETMNRGNGRFPPLHSSVTSLPHLSWGKSMKKTCLEGWLLR